MCSKCRWLDTLTDIETVMEDHNDLKPDTIEFLENIYEWIQQREHCTDKHIAAINKINKRGW
jgi:hypothetical protein